MFTSHEKKPETPPTPGESKTEAAPIDWFEKGIKHFNDYKIRYPRDLCFAYPEPDLEEAIECFSRMPDLGKSFERFSNETLKEIENKLHHRDMYFHKVHFDSPPKPLDKMFARLLLSAAEQGSAKAQYLVGEANYYFYDLTSDRPFYMDSQKSNKDLAGKWLEAAAIQGHADAAFRLGKLHEEYSPREKIMTAVKWYQQAAAQGHKEAQECLEPYTVPSEEKLNFYRKGLGMIESCLAKSELLEPEVASVIHHFKLGEEYESKHEMKYEHSYSVYFSSKKHPSLIEFETKVAQFVVNAAKRGSALAQYHVGYACEKDFNLLENATFSEKSREYIANREVTQHWYQKAAEQGHVDAQYKVASLYAKYSSGRDFPAHWYTCAAKQNHSDAQCALARLYDPGYELMGRDEEKTFKENSFTASYWWRKAAEQNNVDAFLPLAHRYIQGRGIAKNNLRPLQYLCKSLSLEKSGEGLDHFGLDEKRDDIGRWIKQELSEVKSPLSYTQGCFLFYAGVMLTLMKERGEVIEARVKHQKDSHCFVFGGYEVNPYLTLIADCKEQVTHGLRSFIREQGDLFHSLVRQHPAYGEKIIAYFPENKAEIANISSDPGSQLVIEKYAHSVDSLVENLHAFQENPKSTEARQAARLISLIEPFVRILMKPLATVDAAVRTSGHEHAKTYGYKHQ